MMYVSTWDDVVASLKKRPFRVAVRIEKGVLPHPQHAGMKRSGGMPEGQIADYRLVLANGQGFHVKDFGDHYRVHLDEVHPSVNFVEHLRQDAPKVYISGAAAIGAAVGALLSRSSQGALAGAAIAGMLSAVLVKEAKKDDKARRRT